MSGQALLLLAWLATGLAAGGSSDADPGFDLFVFVRSWSPTYCQETQCSIEPISAFTLHGLWPEYNNGGWPEYCGGDRNKVGNGSRGNRHSGGSGGAATSTGGGPRGGRRLHVEALPAGSVGSDGDTTSMAAAVLSSPGSKERHRGRRDGQGAPRGGLRGSQPSPAVRHAVTAAHQLGGPQYGDEAQQQKCEWPSFKGPDADFWAHEWDRHGTCASPVTGNRTAFFQAALRLHEQYNLDAALAAAGIEPSRTLAYSQAQVAAAVEDAYGVAPLLSCYHGQVLEVWMCVDLGLAAQPCPQGVRRSFERRCGAQVQLPVGGAVPADCRPYFPPWNASDGGGQHLLMVRIATGLAVAGAGAAAVALLWSSLRRGRAGLLDRLPDERYDPLERFWQSRRAAQEQGRGTLILS